MVAIAGRESGYRPEAHRTNTDPEKMVGDFGLFQINYINDTPAFRQAIGLTDRSQLLDPEMNAKAAHYLYERAGLKPWTAGPGGWRPDGDPTYGTDVEAARAAVQRAEQSGLIDDPFAGGAFAPPALPIRPTPTAGTTSTRRSSGSSRWPSPRPAIRTTPTPTPTSSTTRTRGSSSAPS